MKVLLKEDVDNLGYAGEVHEVAAGFGRNFLIPKGLAVIASSKVMNQAKSWRKRAETRRAELRAEYELLSSRINEVTLTFTARAGNTGKLFGSVTTAQISDELNKVLGTDIDRRKVGVEPLRQLGEHKVVVRLSGDFQPEVTVKIISDEVARTASPAAAKVEAAVEDVEFETEETEETEEIAETVEFEDDFEAEETVAE